MAPGDTPSRGHGDRKPNRLDAFIVALLTNRSIESAAESCGLSTSTAKRWLRDPQVAAKFREMRRQAMQIAHTQLQLAASESVETLRAVLRDGESESSRVAAAKFIVEASIRLVETDDVLERLERLERAIQQPKGGDAHDRTHAEAAIGRPRANGRA